jgi:deoxyribodipyrimidine photo-lyase
MNRVIYWFRNDLRLSDSPAFLAACKDASELIPVYVHRPVQESSPWGFPRVSAQRRAFTDHALQALDAECCARQSRLLQLHGDATSVLAELARQTQADSIICEMIAAPEEQAEVMRLRSFGISVQEHWQSSLLDPASLPFDAKDLPDMFTQFRRQVETAGLYSRKALSAPKVLPCFPEVKALDAYPGSLIWGNVDTEYQTGLDYLDFYFSGEYPHTYKQTRNQLMGEHFSTNFSGRLALGSLSAPLIAERLKQYEETRGANDGTYWIWFELLWRDYFRFLHLKYGRRLYGRSGLSLGRRARNHRAHESENGAFSTNIFESWTQGQTQNSLVNAGMNELRATGKLSNRMRQIVASYLIYDLAQDWRAGAAWFEAQLLDYDVYSNQGNWLYIAGLGTDPRGGRQMNLDKQVMEHDPQGLYRKQWAQS